MSIKTRQFLVVFPLFLSLVAHSISFPAKFSLHDAEIRDTCIPLISKDYFPASTDSFLVSSKSKSQMLLWHSRQPVPPQTVDSEPMFAERYRPPAVAYDVMPLIIRKGLTQNIVSLSYPTVPVGMFSPAIEWSVTNACTDIGARGVRTNACCKPHNGERSWLWIIYLNYLVFHSWFLYWLCQ
jgi:hypothetical protein